MRARASLVAAVGVLVLGIAGPAAAKVAIADAQIRGPGLGEGGIRVSGPETNGMYESGIDVAGGTDDARADSIAELGLTAAELGPKYVVTYRFAHGADAELVRQELYPYAKGGPVTYTPPGHGVDEGKPWGGAIVAGWYRTPSRFFEYLVAQGLPETNPAPAPASRGSGPDTLPAADPTPWGWIAVALIGLLGLALTAARFRHRLIRVARGSV